MLPSLPPSSWNPSVIIFLLLSLHQHPSTPPSLHVLFLFHLSFALTLFPPSICATIFPVIPPSWRSVRQATRGYDMLPLPAAGVCVCGPGSVWSTEGIRGLYLQRESKRERDDCRVRCKTGRQGDTATCPAMYVCVREWVLRIIEGNMSFAVDLGLKGKAQLQVWAMC